MLTGHRPCPARLDAAVACGSSGSGPVSGRAPHQLPCPRWLPQGPPVSALMAGVRAAAGHPSGPEIAADTGLATRAGHRPSGRRSSRKQRTVNPLMVPARYNLLCSSSRPALRAAGKDTVVLPPVRAASASEPVDREDEPQETPTSPCARLAPACRSRGPEPGPPARSDLPAPRTHSRHRRHCRRPPRSPAVTRAWSSA
jgi:hypothetical protein